MEQRLSQYADDTALALDGSEISLRTTLNILDHFAKFSGLKPNIDKTKAIWIGAKKNEVYNICTDRNSDWVRGQFTLLGVKFDTDLNKMVLDNYNSKLTEMKSLIKTWSKRNISVLGKITVVKSIILPKLTHLFISLPKPSDKLMKELETILFTYIWGSATDKIARKQIIKNYSEGGLKMQNLDYFIKSLKLTWIRKIYSTNTPMLTNILSTLISENFKTQLIMFIFFTTHNVDNGVLDIGPRKLLKCHI